jgi:hypothetical protein
LDVDGIAKVFKAFTKALGLPAVGTAIERVVLRRHSRKLLRTCATDRLASRQ